LEKINNIEINQKKIGNCQEVYVVAEMSGNHNGKIETALEIIKRAKQCGADAIKIQTYTADTITINHNSPEFKINGGLWDGRNLYDLYNEAHTPWEWHEEMFDFAKKIGITIFSSPFDDTAVDFLEKLNAPAYKIASPELIDLNLIKKVARTGKPVILSTGMANKEEIQNAVQVVRDQGNNQIIVLHCTAAYPAPVKESNLKTIPEISNQFNVLSGLSDHTKGTKIAKYASLIGGCFIEKHFTLDRQKGGVDSAFSIEPNELKNLVQDLKEINSIMGKVAFSPTDSEKNVYKTRRSLYVVKDIAKGDILTRENIKSIRPGKGLNPKFLEIALGSIALRDLKFGEPLSRDMFKDK